MAARYTVKYVGGKEVSISFRHGPQIHCLWVIFSFLPYSGRRVTALSSPRAPPPPPLFLSQLKWPPTLAFTGLPPFPWLPCRFGTGSHRLPSLKNSHPLLCPGSEPSSQAQCLANSCKVVCLSVSLSLKLVQTTEMLALLCLVVREEC